MAECTPEQLASAEQFLRRSTEDAEATSALKEAIDAATGVPRQAQKVAQRKELERKAAILGKRLEADPGETGIATQLASLRGELTKVSFEPLALSEANKHNLYLQVFDFFSKREGRVFDNINTKVALQGMTVGKIPAPFQVNLMEEVFGPEVVDALLKKRSFGDKLGDELMELLGVPRTLMSSTDNSMALRQSVIPTLDPLNAKSTKESLQASLAAMRSDKVAVELDELMRATPEYANAVKDGVPFVTFGRRGGAGSQVEGFQVSERTWVGRNLRKYVPPVKWSERAAATYQNQLRLKLHGNWAGSMKKAGNYNPEVGKELGEMIGVLTGRAKLPQFMERFSPLLNNLFFSTRLNMARLKTPWIVAGVNTPKPVRKIIAREIASYVAMGTTVLALIDAADIPGTSVEWDARSSDFAKLKVGGTRVDLWGGFQPLVRFAYQQGTGRRKTSVGNITDIDRFKTTMNLIQSKFSPQAGAVADIARGETIIGEELELDKQIVRALLPLVIQDVIEAVQEQGALGVLAAPIAFFGGNVQSYTTFAVKTSMAIQEDILTGEIDPNDYNPDTIPQSFSELNDGDKPGFQERHADIFEEIERRGEETFGNLSEGERGAAAGATAGVAKERATGFLDELQERVDSGRIDIEDFQGRKGFWNDTSTVRKGRGEVFATLAETFGTRDREALSPAQAAVQKMSEVFERHPSLTIGDEEDWAAFEADLGRSLTPREQDLAEREAQIDRHPLEQRWSELNATVNDTVDNGRSYYDIPADERRFNQSGRELWRRNNPEADAALILLGRVSVPQTPAAANIVERQSRQVFGQSFRPRTALSGLQPIGRIGTLR